MRFIHLSDVHLGAVPDRGTPWSAKREEEIWNSFGRLMGELAQDPVDVIFITGNLFSRQPLKRELERVASFFEPLGQTRVYLMTGPTDLLTETSFYRDQVWPENVFFFEGEEISRQKDPLLPLYIYGASMTKPGEEASLFQEAEPWVLPEEEEGLHILLARMGEEGLDGKSLLRAGFDYVALGGEGAPLSQVRDKAAACGSFEPMEASDEGEHGYLLGWQAEGRIRTRFVPYASRTYRRLEVEVLEEDTRYSVEDKVKEEIRKMGPSNIYTVHLVGQSSLEQLFFFDRLRRLGNILEVVDETKPAYDLARVYESYKGTLLGDFMESFIPAGEAFSLEHLSTMEEKALFYGIQALLETAGSN